MDIHFDWERCLDGYHIAEIPTYGRSIAPKSDRMEKYLPLEHHTALLRQLAVIEEEADLIRFANNFGMLSHPTEPETPELWLSFTRTIRNMLNEYDAGRFGVLATDFNTLEFGKLNIKLDASVNPPRKVAKVGTLHQAIWWQFVEMVTKGQEQEVCAWCQTWFAVGADTGRRKRRSNAAHSYCSPAHQKKHEYSLRPKKKGPRA